MWDRPILQTLFRLLVVEPLPVYTFYVSYLDGLTTLSSWLTLWYYKGQDVTNNGIEDVAGSGVVVGSYVNCIRDDVFAAAFSFDLDYTGTCMPKDGENYLGYVNVIFLMICIFVALCPLVAVIHRGEFDYCSGSYLACKWEFASSKFHTKAASMLLVYTILTVVVAFWLTGEELSAKLFGKLSMAFLMYEMPNVLMLIVSAVALTSGDAPHFDFKSARFQQLYFSRSSWQSLFESDTHFGERLENATLWASTGRMAKLKALVPEGYPVDTVLQGCLRSLSDADLTGEDDTTSDSDEDLSSPKP